MLFMMILSSVAFLKDCLSAVTETKYYVDVVVCHLIFVGILLLFFSVAMKLTYDFLLTQKELEIELSKFDNSKSHR